MQRQTSRRMLLGPVFLYNTLLCLNSSFTAILSIISTCPTTWNSYGIKRRCNCSASRAGCGLFAHAQQRKSLPNRQGRRLLRGKAGNLLRQCQSRRQNRPRCQRGYRNRGPSHTATGIKKLREQSCQMIGLEQTSNSKLLYDFHFQRNTVLVVGNGARASTTRS